MCYYSYSSIRCRSAADQTGQGEEAPVLTDEDGYEVPVTPQSSEMYVTVMHIICVYVWSYVW